MSIGITINEQVRIPPWVDDFDSFQRWSQSPEYPEHGWFAYLGDVLWMDLSMERQVHNQIKTKTNAALSLLTEREETGIYYSDRMQLSEAKLNLLTEPDGMFVSYPGLKSGRVRLIEGDESTAVFGSPDMVLEIVSPNSVEKDTELLPRLYWEARIAEYWLIDSRAANPQLEILRRGRSKYLPTRSDDRWVKSSIFGKEFRLGRRPGVGGVSILKLEMR
jgi:Uma2 family endonuclease